ncbi:hypothetical protein [Streptomyces shenzhenensis]|nr:hypothetical protein [Streptomyces shenzhenensis]
MGTELPGDQPPRTATDLRTKVIDHEQGNGLGMPAMRTGMLAAN